MRQVFRGMNRLRQRRGPNAHKGQGKEQDASGASGRERRALEQRSSVRPAGRTGSDALKHRGQGIRHWWAGLKSFALAAQGGKNAKRHSHIEGQNACVEANSEAIHLHSWSVCGGDFSEVTELLGEMTQDFSFPPTSHPTSIFLFAGRAFNNPLLS